jgi:hypothetical protein
VGGQHHAPAALPPRKTRYPLYKRLGGPQGRSGSVRKISPPLGFDPRTVQPVLSHYTDWATWPTHITITGMNFMPVRPVRCIFLKNEKYATPEHGKSLKSSVYCMTFHYQYSVIFLFLTFNALHKNSGLNIITFCCHTLCLCMVSLVSHLWFVFTGDKPWEFEKVKLGSWSRGESYMENILQVWYMYYITFGSSHDSRCCMCLYRPIFLLNYAREMNKTTPSAKRK